MFSLLSVSQCFRKYLTATLILCFLMETFSEPGHYKFQRSTVENFDAFFERNICPGQKTLPLVLLLNFIAEHHFSFCSPVILYEKFAYDNHPFMEIMAQLFKSFPVPMTHSYFTASETFVNVSHELFINHEAKCIGFIILTQTYDTVLKLLGHQPTNKVVLVSQATNWQMGDFLHSKDAQQIVNLLVIADPVLQRTFKDKDPYKAFDIDMYTHDLFIDPIGGSSEKFLTAWRCNRLTRPHINLFPDKSKVGFNGYRFYVSAVEHPPYAYHITEHSYEDDRLVWDGVEIRLLRLLSEYLNFTINIQEPIITGNNLSGYALNELHKQKAQIAVGGIFLTADIANNFYISHSHYEDCAVFLSLASLALPKYRAIMGPFRWEVWLALTLTYLLAIFPISFSESHSFKHLLSDPWEVENMFWYVFGTFTNLFTFGGKKSWTSGGRRSSTGMFIGIYWTFSIIVTAAYTGSIIAFITIPVFPKVVDNLWQLVEDDYRLSTKNGSGWESLFNTSGDPKLLKLFNEMEVVPSLADGIVNISKSRFFKSYAFMGSRELLRHVVQTNYTPDSEHKKSLFHIGQDCYVRLLVSLVFPKNATYTEGFKGLILRAMQSGLITKISRDIQWEVHRSGKGRLLQVSSGRTLKITAFEDRQLTLDDVQGMFLLLGAGFAIAVAALIVEFITYFCNKYKAKRQSNISQIPSITFTSCEEDICSKLQNEKLFKKSADHLLSYFGSKVILDSYEPSEINFDSTNHNKIYSAPIIIDYKKENMLVDWHRRYSF